MVLFKAWELCKNETTFELKDRTLGNSSLVQSLQNASNRPLPCHALFGLANAL